MTGHKHTFKLVAHVDGCHWWTTTGACACGATLQQTGERSPEDDPYTFEWLEDECGRCCELAGGAQPKFTSEVVAA